MRFLLATPLVLLAACSGKGADPGEVATAFARKWETGECAGLGSLVTSDRGIIGGGVEQACAGRAALRKGPAKEIKEIRVAEMREDGDRATVRLELHYGDGSTKAGDPLVLVRQDGGWRVDLLSTGAARARGLFGRDRDAPPPAAPAPAPPAPVPGNQVGTGNVV